MIDDYARLRVLGRGTSAHVWLAEGPAGRVALKVAHQPGHLRHEIAVLRRVSHPAIARLLDADEGGDWLVLEHAELASERTRHCARGAGGRELSN